MHCLLVLSVCRFYEIGSSTRVVSLNIRRLDEDRSLWAFFLLHVAQVRQHFNGDKVDRINADGDVLESANVFWKKRLCIRSSHLHKK